MVSVKEKIERWKEKAELFIKQDTPACIKKINGDLHFCEILIVGEETILVKNFGPKQREGKKDKIYWLDIFEFDEFKETR